jgi:2-phosphosulfolactate phosphatase
MTAAGDVRSALRQHGSAVRFDWGLAGAAQLRQPGACLVVVDVLSFTTAVTVATGRGMAVLPYADVAGAAEFAAEHEAGLAVRRPDVSAERPWSLSPAGLASAPFVPRLVLPSPNGSAISASADGPAVAACLRNASAVAEWLLGNGYGIPERPAVVIAAGERWPDGSLRAALEDGLGAGAVLHRLRLAGAGLSPEAALMAAAYAGTPDVAAAVRAGASALELAAIGYAADVDVAVAADADGHVPVLRQHAFSAG